MSGVAAPPAPVILISLRSLRTLLRAAGEKASAYWEQANSAPRARAVKDERTILIRIVIDERAAAARRLLLFTSRPKAKDRRRSLEPQNQGKLSKSRKKDDTCGETTVVEDGSTRTTLAAAYSPTYYHYHDHPVNILSDFPHKM